MNFKISTPEFWYKKNSFISWLLWPLSIIYSILSKIKYQIQTPKKFRIPVICIGNATVGGSGKTPTAIALAKLLQKHKYKVAFACRNYNAKIKTPTKVEKKHSSPDIIDEAMLLSGIAPTYVAQNRLDAIKLAAENNHDIIIIDDGLQNNSFYKNLSILIIDESLNLQNQHIFPAGPFRESIKDCLKKSDVIFYINFKKQTLKENIFDIQSKFILPKNHQKKYLAFTGLAFPLKFFKTLKTLDLEIDQTFTFPDHHHYTDGEILNLIQISKNLKIPLITTAKDMIKINNKYKKNIKVLEMSLEIKNEKKLLKIIKEKCA